MMINIIFGWKKIVNTEVTNFRLLFFPCVLIFVCYLNLIPDFFSFNVNWNIKIKISKPLSSYKYLLYIVNKVNLLEYLRTHNYQIHK